MKKIIFLFSISLLLCGCWNYQELTDLAIATGIGIDKLDEQYKVTIMISNASKSSQTNSEGKATTTSCEGVGDTIFGAFKDASLGISKQIYVGHIEVLIISKEIATNNLTDVLDFFFRYPQIRNEFYLLASKETQAGDILKITNSINSFPSESIAKNIEITNLLQASINKITFNQFMKRTIEEGVNPTIPTIEIIGDIEKGNSEDNIKKISPDAYLKLDGLALFKKNKLVTFSNKDESRGINILNNQVHISDINVPCDDKYISIEIISAKTKYDFDLSNELPKVKIKTTIHSSIQEISCDRNLEDVNTIKEIETLSKNTINDLIDKGIKLAKKYQTDIFGFGKKIYKKDYKYWNKIKDNWSTIFENIEYEIETEVDLESKGNITNRIEANS